MKPEVSRRQEIIKINMNTIQQNKGKNMTHAVIWMNLKNVLSEGIQTQEDYMQCDSTL